MQKEAIEKLEKMNDEMAFKIPEESEVVYDAVNLAEHKNKYSYRFNFFKKIVNGEFIDNKHLQDEFASNIVKIIEYFVRPSILKKNYIMVTELQSYMCNLEGRDEDSLFKKIKE